jgi:hypothetical protein
MSKVIKEEEELETIIAFWEAAEDEAKKAQETAKEYKEQVRVLMQQIGLHQHKTLDHSVTLKKTLKTNIIGPYKNPKKDREAFELMLHNKGLYDKFTETRLSLDKVKDYCEAEGDDLYGTIEVETSYTPVLYKGKPGQE